MSERYKKIMKLIEELNQEELPEGHALVYVGDNYIDLLTNIVDGEQAADIIVATMKTSVSIVLDIVANMSDDDSIQEATEHFIGLFKQVLFEGIAVDEDLFISYLSELDELLQEQEEAGPMVIKTEQYN